ncbi:MAG: hypothetical protein IJZ42_06360 [Lachnospiraceae bacterium]|nr:hypothetical protein [Lachnospiraceae bacterium]
MSLMAFLSSFASYLMVFFVFVIVIVIAVFLGIGLYKLINKDKLKEEAEAEE